MSEYIGPEQLNLIWALRRGVPLYQEQGRWYTFGAPKRYYQNRERCMSLYTRGYIMAGGTEEGAAFQGGYRTAYFLTEKGKRA